MTRPLATALLLVAVAGATAGCGADPYRNQPEDAVHLFLPNEMKGFDPAFADEEVATINVLNVYDTLLEYHYLKRPFELQPCLAAAMPEVTDEQRTYTFRLKPGVRYVDDPCFPEGRGREVVADDVVFCLSRLLDARVNSPGSWVLEGVLGAAEFHEATQGGEKNRTSYPDFPGIRAVDSHTVRIELSAAQSWFPWLVAMAYTSIYPPEAVGHYGDDFQNHAVGTGPYRVTEFERAHRLVLERNPAYREDTYPSEGTDEDRERGLLADAGKRLPIADRIVATPFKDLTPQWLYFMQGFLDRTGIPKDNFDGAVDTKTMDLRADMKERGVRLAREDRLEVIYEGFNMEDPVLGAPAGAKGLAIRRAMSLAYDDEWVAEHLYNRRVRRVDGPLLPELSGFDPAFRNEWKRAEGETRDQALARARKLLADAGLPGGRGIPTIVYDVPEDETSLQHYKSFARDMGDIGISVRPNTVTWQQLISRLNGKQAQMWGLSWGADYPDAQNFLQLFYSPYASPGPNNVNYSNPEYDALYEKAVQLPEGDERTALYRKMQEIVVRDCVWIFRFRRINFNLDHAWFRGFKYNDVYPKYYKYVHADGALRTQKVDEWNAGNAAPLVGPIVAGVVLVLSTIFLARRATTSW